MKNLPYRKNPRLKHYDYSSSGQYFVTICTHHRISIFGEISDGKMILNNLGEIAQEEIIKTSELRSNVEINHFVVMPNHVHMIVEFLQIENKTENIPRIFASPKNNISSLIRGYKSAVTKRCRVVLHTTESSDSIWQPKFHDHIIRNETSYETIAQYIDTNPEKWKDDMFFVTDI